MYDIIGWTTTHMHYLLAGLCVSTSILLKFLISRWNSKPFPPGPPRALIFGNALQYPKPSEHSWLKFSEWSKCYGDIVYLDLLGRPMVILHSVRAAKDLLDKRSKTYSGRPHLVMANELSGYNQSFSSMAHGDEWRRQRQLMAREFTSASINQYSAVQEYEARRLAFNVLGDASSLQNQVKLRIAAIILRVTYGYHLTREDDPIYTKGLEAMSNFIRAITPGAWVVDFIPALRYLPSWAPGAGFLRVAADWRRIHDEAAWDPYLWAKNETESGTSLTPNLYANSISRPGAVRSITGKDICICMYCIPGWWNMASILTFFLAMVLHPSIQDRAHDEIISVIGTERLPSITDRDKLPFLRSVITEALRWNPATPLGLYTPCLDADDMYNGMYLPKGSIIVANVWHMAHDPEIFEDPSTFNPDRYHGCDSAMLQVTDFSFGFGRRACPGQYFAQNTLFIIVATILATCRILPTLDEDGKPQLPPGTFTPTGVSFPTPFDCRIEARSNEAFALLESAALLPAL
ncbi:cytochrome P450 [Infundibulicybe gibba]|nr:cytochrome P450 [Infundibulicybe gibba]